MNIIRKIENEIESAILKSLNTCMSKGLLPEIVIPTINIETPKDSTNGDKSSNIAMLIVKQAKKNPRMIAQAIIDNMDLTNTYMEKVECAGPGFLNFYLKTDWLYDGLAGILKEKEKFGESDYGKMEKIMVEYVSANPTGPLHMGNARGGALGDLIANVFIKSGHDVCKEFYVNDAGNQIERFGLSLEARYLQEKLGEDSVEFPEDGYQGADIIVHAKEYIAIEKEDLTKVDSKTRKEKLVQYALPLNLKKIKEGLAQYRIEFDNWFSEKSLYESGMVEETMDYLIKNNHTLEKEGAIWVKAESIGTEEDVVLIRSNGFHTYYTADLAYHWNKFRTRKFKRVINLLGADHHGHVARMKGGMDAIGVGGENLEIVLFQLVRLYRNGEVARMSKRTGKAITLTDLLDEVGVDASRFFFNMKASGSHLDFDLDLAVKQSNENPVFYVQYAYARICSMLRLLKEEGYDINKEDGVDYTLLNKKEELALLNKLSQYTEEIIISTKTLEPSRITRYVMDLAGLFHSFYNACRVRGEENDLLYARLALVKGSKIVLANALELLSISAPERM